MAMILEPNPSKRSSLLEIKGLLTQVWNTEEDETARETSRLISKGHEEKND